MENTLYPGDKIIISKLFTINQNSFSLFTENKHTFFFYLNREDIIVFKYKKGLESPYFVKRIIGLPGDLIEIKNSQIIVNKNKLLERAVYKYNYTRKIKGIELTNTISNAEYYDMPREVRYKWIKNNKPSENLKKDYFFPEIKKDTWDRNNYGTLLIPKKGLEVNLTMENLKIYSNVLQKTIDEYKNKIIFNQNYFFVLGDNRHNSLDSRAYGFVPADLIEGKFILAY